MTTITARIPEDLNDSLSLIAKTMERSKSFVIYKAIERYIKEAEEDIKYAQKGWIPAFAGMTSSSLNILALNSH